MSAETGLHEERGSGSGEPLSSLGVVNMVVMYIFMCGGGFLLFRRVKAWGPPLHSVPRTSGLSP